MTRSLDHQVDHWLTLEVDNVPGVLARVTTILHRHGVNIEFLKVKTVSGESHEVSMNIVCDSRDLTLIMRRMAALINVREVGSVGSPDSRD